MAPSPVPTSSSLGSSNVDPSIDTGGASTLPLSLTVLLPSCIISGLLLFALFFLVFMCRRKDNIRIKCLCFECVHRGETGTSGLNLNGSSTTMIQGQNYNRFVINIKLKLNNQKISLIIGRYFSYFPRLPFIWIGFSWSVSLYLNEIRMKIFSNKM